MIEGLNGRFCLFPLARRSKEVGGFMGLRRFRRPPEAIFSHFKPPRLLGGSESAIFTDFDRFSKMLKNASGRFPGAAELIPRSARFRPAVAPNSSPGQPQIIPKSAQDLGS